MPTSPIPWGLGPAVALFVGWLLLSQLRHVFELWPGVSVWYAPAALIAAGAILWGWRSLLAIVAASLVLALWSDRGGESVARYLASSVLLKSIYVLGAAILRRARFDGRFTKPRDVLRFGLFAAGCGLAAALLNSMDLVTAGVLPAGDAAQGTLVFWVGDLVAVLALAPALLVAVHWIAGERGPRRSWGHRWWRIPTQAASVPIALWVAFGLAPHLGFLSYSLCFLPLGWVSLTQGVRGSAVMTAALAMGAVTMLHQSGVVPRDNLEVQSFMASLALAGLLLGSVADQSERGRALLAESEERYRALVELLPVPLMVHRDGRAIFANDAAARTFAAPSAEALIGLSLRDMADPMSKALVAERVQRLASGESLDVAASHRFRRLDGGHVDLEAVSTPIRFPDGPAALTVARDVTERNRLENELRHSQRMDAVGQLAGGVAHDFNNLLTVIIGYGQLLVSETNLEEIRFYARETLDAAGRAAALTRQLLAFSRKQVSQPREVAVNEVLGATETMLRRLLGPTTELQVALGSDAGAVLIDPVQLDQVVLNLALNGRDAMPNGGVLSIETRAVTVPGEDPRWGTLPAGRYAALAVRDTGTGIDESIRERIFDPFFTTKEAGRGTGLGLATVYGIVAEAKGSIFVDTVVGEGSTFTVLLPLVAERAPVAGPANDGAAPDAAAIATQRRVMVVEDDEAVRAVTRRMLERAGYAVVEAPNGRVALEALAALPTAVDVVVTDFAMPEMNGTALARSLRERCPELPVILMSGFADAAREGATTGLPLLQKPLDAQVLTAAVAKALEKREAAAR